MDIIFFSEYTYIICTHTYHISPVKTCERREEWSISSALKVRIARIRVSSQERARVGNFEICFSRNLRAVNCGLREGLFHIGVYILMFTISL